MIRAIQIDKAIDRAELINMYYSMVGSPEPYIFVATLSDRDNHYLYLIMAVNVEEALEQVRQTYCPTSPFVAHILLARKCTSDQCKHKGTVCVDDALVVSKELLCGELN